MSNGVENRRLLTAVSFASLLATVLAGGLRAEEVGKAEAAGSDPAAVAVVEKYLEAIGGREVLGAIEDFSSTYRNVKYSATGETVANITFFMKRGYKYREEWDIEGFRIEKNPLAFVQIYNGDLLQGWVSMFGTVSTLEGRTLEVFVWDKYIDDFFMHWEEDGYTLKLAGQGLVDDTHPADIVEVTDFTGRQTVRCFFSTEDGLLLKKEWQDFTQKEVAKKEQYYRRYRRVLFSDGSGRGVQFPLQIQILLDGDLDTERIYSMVKFNANLSDKLFERPEGIDFAEAMAKGMPILGGPSESPPEGTKEGAAAAHRAAERKRAGPPPPEKIREGSAPREPPPVPEGSTARPAPSPAPGAPPETPAKKAEGTPSP